MRYLRTSQCIVCLKKAEGHHGHVMMGEEHVLAGWCNKHTHLGIHPSNSNFWKRIFGLNIWDYHFLNNSIGCFGGWIESYGILSNDLPSKGVQFHNPAWIGSHPGESNFSKEADDNQNQ